MAARVGFAALLGLVVPALAESQELNGQALRSKCNTLVETVATSGKSDAEIAFTCRAAYPPALCREMRESLGMLPWKQDAIEGACKQWEQRTLKKLMAMPPDRRAMSYEELQATLESCAQQKQDFGYNMPTHPDGTVDLEKAAEQKWEQTQKATAAYNEYMGYDTTSYSYSHSSNREEPLPKQPEDTLIAALSPFQKRPVATQPQPGQATPEQPEPPALTAPEQPEPPALKAQEQPEPPALMAPEQPEQGQPQPEQKWANGHVESAMGSTSTMAIIGFSLVSVAMIGASLRIASRSSQRDWAQISTVCDDDDNRSLLQPAE